MAERRSHAVVLGSGFAGLLASRVLSEFYESVTVVERDVLPDRPEHRKGVPQGRHLHNFLSRGTQLLGELFPGILTELATAGATVDEGDDLSRLYVRSFGYELTPSGKLADPQPLAAYQASRPFVEFHVRRRLTGLANVTILDNHTMVEPLMAANTIVGARIVNNANGIAGDHGADLVVDATGRASRATFSWKVAATVRYPRTGSPRTGDTPATSCAWHPGASASDWRSSTRAARPRARC